MQIDIFAAFRLKLSCEIQPLVRDVRKGGFVDSRYYTYLQLKLVLSVDSPPVVICRLKKSLFSTDILVILHLTLNIYRNW